jgi:hypothetical protein
MILGGLTGLRTGKSQGNDSGRFALWASLLPFGRAEIGFADDFFGGLKPSAPSGTTRTGNDNSRFLRFAAE